MGVAQTRKDQHDRIVWAEGERVRTGAWPGKPATNLQHVHGFEARHGGAGAWIDVPVTVLPTYAPKPELNRAERA
jgi:hypothetical protein